MIKKYLIFFATLFCLSAINGQQTVGLFYNSTDSFDGFTLFPTSSNGVFLIDNCGKLIHQWEVSAEGYGPALLLPNGDLLKSIRNPVTNFAAGGGAGRIERYAWEGDLLWEMEYNDDQKLYHHDLTFLPNGNIIFLAWEKRSILQCQQAGRPVSYTHHFS